jgi:hypothetical protein
MTILFVSISMPGLHAVPVFARDDGRLALLLEGMGDHKKLKINSILSIIR